MIEFSLSESAKYTDARVAVREAVRAVIFQGNKLLLIYSTVRGDYKFPGGGIKRGESGDEALRREIREECGAELTTVGRLIGQVKEERPAFDKEFDTFVMTSRYYLCTVDKEEISEQELDDYEADLGFTPVWITPDDALKANEKILAEDGSPPVWTKRETRFLQALINME